MRLTSKLIVVFFALSSVLYSQSFNEQWGAQGLTVGNIYGDNQQQAVLCSDGNGGSYVAWQDDRSDLKQTT